jgi:methylmalonyl-CoA epimerase
MRVANKIDHIAIAVKDLEAAVKTFTGNFGFPIERMGDVPALHMQRAFLTIGDASLELFQPTSDANPAAKFIAERGEGMYTLSLEVDDLNAATDALAKKGITVNVQKIPNGPRLGFISPKATHGVLLQLIEHPHSQPVGLGTQQRPTGAGDKNDAGRRP